MGDVRPVIAVTGTRREGMVLSDVGVRVIAAGGDSAKLAEDLARLAPNAAGLISFGMAGGGKNILLFAADAVFFSHQFGGNPHRGEGLRPAGHQ